MKCIGYAGEILVGVPHSHYCTAISTRWFLALPSSVSLEKTQGRFPHTTHDMRTVFDDKDVHGVVVATPEQWHALATIRACPAGKDVYVEKCISRRVEEGVAGKRKPITFLTHLQAGTERRMGYASKRSL